MACRGCLECLLKLLNLLLTLVGLAMVGYGIYLLVEYERTTTNALLSSSVSGDGSSVQLSRPLLMGVSLSASILDDLPKAWYGCWSHFVYFFVLCFSVVASLSCLNSLLRTTGIYFEFEMRFYGKWRNGFLCLISIEQMCYSSNVLRSSIFWGRGENEEMQRKMIEERCVWAFSFFVLILWKKKNMNATQNGRISISRLLIKYFNPCISPLIVMQWIVLSW